MRLVILATILAVACSPLTLQAEERPPPTRTVVVPPPDNSWRAYIMFNPDDRPTHTKPNRSRGSNKRR